MFHAIMAISEGHFCKSLFGTGQSVSRFIKSLLRHGTNYDDRIQKKPRNMKVRWVNERSADTQQYVGTHVISRSWEVEHVVGKKNYFYLPSSCKVTRRVLCVAGS